MPVNWREQRVLTTAQIAERFGCPVDNIQRNFNRNRDQFIENEDYFKLTGDALRDLRTICPEVVAPRTPVLYLWTEWGVLLHVKMINSDEAWATYKKLVKFYFHYRDVVAQPQPAQIENPSTARRRAAQLAPACVYVVLFQNTDGEFVKIGLSGEPNKRIAVIKHQTKSIVNDLHITSFMPRKATGSLEWLIKEKFSSRRIKGEFFSADFKKICESVDDFAKKILSKPLDENAEFINRADLLAGENFLLVQPVINASFDEITEFTKRADLLAGEKIF